MVPRKTKQASPNSLSSRLKRFYIEKDLSTRQLAALIGGRISGETVRRVINGSTPRARTAHKIEAFLDRVTANAA